MPAFYGDWFVRRLTEGFVRWENPFGRQLHGVSLKREDVRAFAFWSKNFRPFLPALREIKAAGYPCFFNYTMTGLPRPMEPAVVEAEDALDSLKALSEMFSPGHIHWRYDPIVISDMTEAAYHVERFSGLARRLEGFVGRCVISFVCMYGKVKRNFALTEKAYGIRFRNPNVGEKRDLAEKLAGIAESRGMTLHVCCGHEMVGGAVAKAHCIDGDVLSRLYPGEEWKGRARPTRKGCGCTESTDIGAYDTCPHGCIYCYANVNKAKADAAFRNHDPKSDRLGDGEVPQSALAPQRGVLPRT